MLSVFFAAISNRAHSAALSVGILLGSFTGIPFVCGTEGSVHEKSQRPIQLTVDATSITRRVVLSTMTIPANPGPLTLFYPKWIPGTHGPNGPIARLGGLKLAANGATIPWKRDAVDLFAFHCDVPEGATAVNAELMYAIPPSPPALDVSSGIVASSKLAFINWNALVLYPQGKTAEECQYTAKLLLPQGWKHASALSDAKVDGDTIEFERVSLERLVDSPVLAGANLRTYPLKLSDGVPHFLDVATESAKELELTPEFLRQVTGLAAESGTLFGTRHYRSFHFLLALSQKIPGFGLEHHECTVNSASPAGPSGDPQSRWWLTFLLAHEYVHSWNGKHRRPAEMICSNYQQPEKTELLWVYEGLTQYLGLLMDARSRFWTPEQFRDELANTAGNLDYASARAWRPLLDTAIAAPLGGAASGHSWRGQSDYYYEGALIWLEADALIRQQTQGRQSLDDFCRRFFGATGGDPSVKGYQFEDVMAGLRDVAPYDWKQFFTTRLSTTGERLPLGGIERSGWKLVYTQTPLERSRQRQGRDLSASLGLMLGESGTISEVLQDMPAAKAGLVPGMKVVRVNDRAWSAAVMHEALKKAKAGNELLSLAIDDEGTVKSYQLNYHGGERFPHLERDAGKPDLLTEILKPKNAGS